MISEPVSYQNLKNTSRVPRGLIREAAQRLEGSGVPEARASAEILMAELLGCSRGELPLLSEPLSAGEAALYESWVLRRGMREPVQRILGYAYFRHLKLTLGAETLIPRPDTESVVDAALERLGRRGDGCRVLELGTGSGAIAISLAREGPTCKVYATDVSEAALQLARHNAARASQHVQFRQADLTFGLDGLAGGIDLLVSNPPNVASAALEALEPEVRDWEPHAALDGGPDGLDFYRRIFDEASWLLAPGADVVLEVGDGQSEEVMELGRATGYEPLGALPDLTGSVRVALLRRA